jgi:hypothetical protein
MSAFCGVDPGLRGCGVAILRDDRVVWAGYVRNPDRESRDCRAWTLLGRVVRDRVEGALREWTKLLIEVVPDGLAVIEEQQVYREAQWKGDSGDVLQVQGVAAAVACCLSEVFGVSRVRTVLPAVWKGQVPKEVYHETRVWPRMTPDDHKRVVLPGAKKLRLDVWDALGLAYYGRDRVSRWVGGVQRADPGGLPAVGGSSPGGHHPDLPGQPGPAPGARPVPRRAVGQRRGEP